MLAPGKGGAGVTLTGGTAGPSLESAFPNGPSLEQRSPRSGPGGRLLFLSRCGGCVGFERGCLEAPTVPKLMS